MWHSFSNKNDLIYIKIDLHIGYTRYTQSKHENLGGTRVSFEDTLEIIL